MDYKSKQFNLIILRFLIKKQYFNETKTKKYYYEYTLHNKWTVRFADSFEKKLSFCTILDSKLLVL